MAGGSQLKRLKASLRDQGITGQQKSKKAKKDGVRPEQRAQRSAALAGIRDSFNPFEVKAPARPKKMQVTTLNADKQAKRMIGRPGVTKSMGEEARRKTLLLEVQSRNKAGGIVDRRIGEADEDMTAEEKALKRFTREKKKGRSAFDLEVDEEDMLTHAGRALNLGANGNNDDFDAGSLAGSSDEEASFRGKRKRLEEDSEIDGEEEVEDAPEKKKSRAEILKDVIAKSKLHKYERQKDKEDDDDVRDELDKGMGDLQSALFSFVQSTDNRAKSANTNGQAIQMNADRANLMGASDKDYERRMREIAMDARAKASEKTKTEEQKADELAAKAKEEERKRLLRMRGEEDDSEASDEDQDDEDEKAVQKVTDSRPVRNEANGFVADIIDDAAEFGLAPPRTMDRPPGFEDDEDEFVIEEGLVDSGSEMVDEDDADVYDAEDLDSEDLPPELLALRTGDVRSDDDLLEDDQGDAASKPIALPKDSIGCPQTVDTLLLALKDLPETGIPEFIRQIRVRNEASIAAGNKEKLQHFAEALVDLLGASQSLPSKISLPTTEQIIRHIHSMSRTYPLEIATAFRKQLLRMSQSSDITSSDLIVLTAIGSIYPTSDHFHQVVTPAITLMSRWLALTIPKTEESLRTGAYVVALALKYQSLSKRYIPEAIRFTVSVLRTRPASYELLNPHIQNMRTMILLWSGKSALREIFVPGAAKALHAVATAQHRKGVPNSANTALQTLQALTLALNNSATSRLPLQLHTHKPVAIKSSFPKFEESFQPGKHYDPDTERFEANKLRKEYKREKKGALRELRKDANFLARESLRAKKEKDQAYEEKYRKLVASIQGEEGREKNEYEREKRMRKGKSKGRR